MLVNARAKLDHTGNAPGTYKANTVTDVVQNISKLLVGLCSGVNSEQEEEEDDDEVPSWSQPWWRWFWVHTYIVIERKHHMQRDHQLGNQLDFNVSTTPTPDRREHFWKYNDVPFQSIIELQNLFRKPRQ